MINCLTVVIGGLPLDYDVTSQTIVLSCDWLRSHRYTRCLYQSALTPIAPSKDVQRSYSKQITLASWKTTCKLELSQSGSRKNTVQISPNFVVKPLEIVTWNWRVSITGRKQLRPINNYLVLVGQHISLRRLHCVWRSLNCGSNSIKLAVWTPSSVVHGTNPELGHLESLIAVNDSDCVHFYKTIGPLSRISANIVVSLVNFRQNLCLEFSNGVEIGCR